MELNTIIVCIIVAISIFGWICCGIFIKTTFSRISQLLDNYLQGKANVKDEMKETRESKIARQLRSIIEQADREKQRAKEEKEEVEALLSDLSHQLKTPLANISMYVELLQEENLSNQERAEFIKKISEQQQKMEWLTKMLVQISRLEVGIIEFEPTRNLIKQTLAESVSMVFAASAIKNIEIEIQEFEDLELIHNRKWTKEAIANILENSIKYSPAGSKIKIQIEPMEIYTRIKFIDQGIGIPKEEYNDIFKRFYRGKQVGEKEGSGIGLYLTSLILSKEGGYITVDSSVGKGSTFTVYLLNYYE